MDEEPPIGAYEKLSYNLPQSPTAEPPVKPERPTPTTNFWEVVVNRRELIISLGTMFAVLLLIIVGYGQKESHDIASVRSENRAASDAIISEIRANNKAAIDRSAASAERSNKLAASMNQLVGIVDTLTRELISGNEVNRKP